MKRKKKPRQKKILYLRWGFLSFFWGTFCLFVMTLWFAYDLPSIEELQNLGRCASITVQDRRGQIIAQSGDLYGTMVHAEKLPRHVKQAILAVEDRRFYTHFGLDILGLIRATWVNWRAGHVVQGGSTLTQQLAKNFLLAKKLYKIQDRSYRRKVQEVLLSLWLEYNFTKDQILTLYLNRSYFGAGTFGLSAAAQRYFKKEPLRLNVYEAAVIAGLLKAPSRYSPIQNPNQANQRAQVVLNSMVEAGFLSFREQDQLSLQEARMVSLNHQESFAHYFSDWIMEEVQEKWGHLGKDLIVQTTLDHPLQSLAENTIKRSELLKKYPSYQVAFISMTPDGAVRALVGGRDYTQSQFNRATQALRQSGSTFKLFPFLAALEKGWTTTSTVSDRPLNLQGWTPKNYQWVTQGEIPLVTAFSKSVNTATVRLAQKIGIDQIRQKAQELGLSRELPRDLSVVLGSAETTLIELTGAYSVIANNGFKMSPYGILKVSDRQGNVFYHHKAQPLVRLVSKFALQGMMILLKSVMLSGTGRGSTLNRPCAGKTGTTQTNRDAWFVGFTPDLITGVWLGQDDGKPMNSRITGSSGPIKLWKVFMETAHAGLPVHFFPCVD